MNLRKDRLITTPSGIAVISRSDVLMLEAESPWRDTKSHIWLLPSGPEKMRRRRSSSTLQAAPTQADGVSPPPMEAYCPNTYCP